MIIIYVSDLLLLQEPHILLMDCQLDVTILWNLDVVKTVFLNICFSPEVVETMFVFAEANEIEILKELLQAESLNRVIEQIFAQVMLQSLMDPNLELDFCLIGKGQLKQWRMILTLKSL